MFRAIVFYAGCGLAWFVLLPLFVLVGGLALLCYAVFTEVGALYSREADRPPDNSTARQIAERMCVGH
ncbi:MAG: hypothetical protein M3N97_10860 [Pseudomonadota bacterium]|nr:hypothetical protein [Pseudomonadota bacterium]